MGREGYFGHIIAMNTPLVTIGLPVYNGAHYLRTTLDSLLAQTWQDFALIIWDDASTDESYEIACSYARKDNRLTVRRHDTNVGMINNFGSVVRAASSPFFMWASDHDIWEPAFIEKLVAEIQEDKKVVLAYSLVRLIDSDGNEIIHRPKRFETSGMSLVERLEEIFKKGEGYGSMIYGLFRRDALCECGFYRKVLIPDTVLIWEIITLGNIIQVPEVLWNRRLTNRFSLERQKRSIFQKMPWYANIPWPIVGAICLAWNTIVMRRTTYGYRRIQFLKHSVNFFRHNRRLIKRDYLHKKNRFNTSC